MCRAGGGVGHDGVVKIRDAGSESFYEFAV